MIQSERIALWHKCLANAKARLANSHDQISIDYNLRMIAKYERLLRNPPPPPNAPPIPGSIP